DYEEIVDPVTLSSQPNYVKASAIIPDVDQFDAEFFGYSAKEAAMLDPQQRIFLECAWEALESAGYGSDITPENVGVYAGAGFNNYFLNNVSGSHQFAHNRNFWAPMQDLLLTMTQERDFLPTRVSYKLNLQGPSVNIQTASSTSLAAVHLACQALRNGECKMALAGAVAINVPQHAGYMYHEGLIFAPDGHCRSFDADAQGTVFGNGAGIVLLKPLPQALADRDQIYAVIKGSAANNDGAAKVGYTAPSVSGQMNVINAALENAGVTADTISYVEAHGTATAMGDPVEITALTRAFRQATQQTGFCAIGTAKGNLGHLTAAAGMPGLMKTALALKHELLPPTLHFRKPNPLIDFANSPFTVNTNLTEWSTNGNSGTHPRRAGVSSFGMGGTNVHIILEEFPQLLSDERSKNKNHSDRWHLLTLAAQNDHALLDMVQRYCTHLQDHLDVALADLCFTTQVGRKHFSHRLALVARSVDNLLEQLKEVADSTRTDFLHNIGMANTAPEHGLQTAFLFTGQGSQYVDMGRQLYDTQPVFRHFMDYCDELLSSYLDSSLLEVLYPDGSTHQDNNRQEDALNATSDSHGAALLDQTAYTQPALFALEYALAQLWLSWGIEPAVVMGHSVGEYVAACLAGVFSLEDGLKLIAERGRLMQRLPQDGAMAVVFAAEAQVMQRLSDYAAMHGDTDDSHLAIAAINGPENVVISGNHNAVQAVCQELASGGIESKQLTVSHAFHSPLMEPILAEFKQIAQEVSFSKPHGLLISNITGKVAGAEVATPDYWCNHIVASVRFAEGMQTLGQQSIDGLIEIGPKPVLLGMGRACLPEDTGHWLPSLHPDHPDEAQLLQSLSALYMAGATVDWVRYAQNAEGYNERRRLPLPTYPFQRQRYWIDMPSAARPRYQSAPEEIHPLLGHQLQLADSEKQRFESRIDTRLSHLAWLSDHRVDETAIMPLTGYLETSLAAGTQLYQNAAFAITDLLVYRPLVLAEEQATTLQYVLQPTGSEEYDLKIFYQDDADLPPSTAQWHCVVSGQMRSSEQAIPLPASLPLTADADEITPQIDIAALCSRCSQQIEPVDFYDAYHMNYGAMFELVQALWRGEDEVIAKIQTPPALLEQLETYHLHPAVLDACLHILGAIMPAESYLPMLVERLQIYRRPEAEVWSYACLHPQTMPNGESETPSADLVVGDIYLFDTAGHLVAVMLGTTFKRVDTTQLMHNLKPLLETALEVNEWLYQVNWARQTSSKLPTSNTQNVDHWLIFTDHNGIGDSLGQQLARLGQPVTTVQASETYSNSADHRYTLDPQQPAHFAQMMATLQQGDNVPTQYGIVYLWHLDETTDENTSSEELPQAAIAGCTNLLHLVQSLAQTNQACTLWLITQGAQPVPVNANAVPPVVNVQQSALWGLGRVIGQEHPEMSCVLLDLAPEVT
ncbi:MAG: beta-ketoacyl synthase N-terminal-like domain-containing protein, partial [Chloroflexota bacterium]